MLTFHHVIDGAVVGAATAQQEGSIPELWSVCVSVHVLLLPAWVLSSFLPQFTVKIDWKEDVGLKKWMDG